MISYGIDTGNSGKVKLVALAEDGAVVCSSFKNLDRLWDTITVEPKNRIAISLPGQHTLARFVKIPPVAPKRIPDIVRYEAAQQIPFDIDEVEWFYHQLDTVEHPTDLEVAIFGIKKELLHEQLNQFKNLGFRNIHVAQADMLALYNALHYANAFEPDEDGDTVIVLDIGHRCTQLLVVTTTVTNNGPLVTGLWTRTIPIGGETLIKAMQEQFKLSEDKAKTLLETVEDSEYKRQIFQTLQPVYANLVQEIQRSVGFYMATHRDAKLKSMIVTGGCSKIPGLTKHLEQSLSLPNVTTVRFDDRTIRDDNQFWVAYGLALQAAGTSHIDKQFIPSPHTWLKELFNDFKSMFNDFIALKSYFRISIAMVVLFVFLSILSLSLSDPASDDSVLDVRDPGVSTPQVAMEQPYALIRIDMLPNGEAKITSEYSPAYDEYDANRNPLSHRIAKLILQNSDVDYRGTFP